MTVMDSKMSATALTFRLGRSAATWLLCGAVLAAPAAWAQPTGTNQAAPGLADTPGSKPSTVEGDRALTEDALKVEDGRALLDSDKLLKVYYYAYSGDPLDYSAILTANTDDIQPPRPVQPTAAERQAIDQLIKMARAHPDVLIKVDDITLEPYDSVKRSYQIQNRLFIKGVRYYFDNSAFHFYYVNADAFRELSDADARTMPVINAAISEYQHFSMDIRGRVSGAVAKDRALGIDLQAIRLKDAGGGTLLSRGGP